MSKGSYRGRPLEDYSKEQLIDIVVEVIEQSVARLRNRTSQQREDDDYRDMTPWQGDEKD